MTVTRQTSAVAAALVLALGACAADDGDDATATDASEQAADDASDDAEEDATGEGEEAGDGDAADEAGEPAATVTATNFAFDPNDLEVASGDAIEFTVAEGSHSFTSTDAGFDTGVLSDVTTTVTVDAEPGTYDFVSTLPAQMTGTLTVTPAS